MEDIPLNERMKGAENCSSNPLQSDAQRRKKPRREKKNKLAGQEFPSVSNQEQAAIGRPSKKRLRKMKYQQKQLSPAEFLLVSAENARFTGSIWMKEGHTHNLASTDRVQVVTSSSLHSSKDHAGRCFEKTASDPSSGLVCIRIQPLLVIDLNGILCHRIRWHKEPPDAHPASYRPALAHVANTPVIPRPNLESFLQFLDQNFCLALWTSAKRKTATALVRSLLPPEIASRLLFLWGQDRCKVVKIRNDKKMDSVEVQQEHGTTIFEKDLAQVWSHFPLWNVNNTILIDDSPDKCLSWKHNAIHPAPLNGRSAHVTATLDMNGNMQPVLSDDKNDELQRAFFCKLVDHWRDSPLIHEWDLHAGDSTFHAPRRHQVDFLREHATGHMGWE